MRNKRGQFYLLVAVFIVVLIVVFATVSNYSRKSEYIRLYDLKTELGIESGRVIDYGIYNSRNQVEDFLTNYTERLGSEKEVYYIYGDAVSVTFYGNKDVEGKVSIEPQLAPPLYKKTFTNPTGIKTAIITLNDREYKFDLQKGQNFYFVITQVVQDERYVVTS